MAGIDNKAYNPPTAQQIRDLVAVQIQVGNAMCQLKSLNSSCLYDEQWKRLTRKK
jgi:hypothetical protein